MFDNLREGLKNLTKKDLSLKELQEKEENTETFEFLKIQNRNVFVIEEKEATDLLKKGIFYIENLELGIRIYDIDKYNPQQIIDFLLTSGIRKNNFWRNIIITFVTLCLLFILYKFISGKVKTQPAPLTQLTQQIQAIPQEKINTGNIAPIQQQTQTQPIQTKIIETGITQKDLDLIFCGKDNESLNKYNNELLKENQDLLNNIETIKTNYNNCLSDKAEKDKVKDFYFSIGEQVSKQCKETKDENTKKACVNLVNNYFKYE